MDPGLLVVLFGLVAFIGYTFDWHRPVMSLLSSIAARRRLATTAKEENELARISAERAALTAASVYELQFQIDDLALAVASSPPSAAKSALLEDIKTARELVGQAIRIIAKTYEFGDPSLKGLHTQTYQLVEGEYRQAIALASRAEGKLEAIKQSLRPLGPSVNGKEKRSELR